MIKKINPQRARGRVCRKKGFLGDSVKNLRVSVVKLLQKTFTTETQRSHRDTEIDFPDRLRSGRQHKAWGASPRIKPKKISRAHEVGDSR